MDIEVTSVSWLGQWAVRRAFVVNTSSTDIVGVENVVLTTKGLQDRDIQLLDGTTV